MRVYQGTLFVLGGASLLSRRGSGCIAAVDSVDLTIPAGGFVALEGPSGSGKTTLLQLLGALDRANSGQVYFDGRDLGALGDNDLAGLRLRTFGFVFQQFNLIPTLTALENVESGLAPMGVSGPELKQRSLAALEEVGLEERADHLPSQLSGGEQQRVAIARALVKGPKVILADEPTGNLDSKTGTDIIELLAGLAARHGTTVIVATHDAGHAARAYPPIGMRDGRVLAQPVPACSSRRTGRGPASTGRPRPGHPAALLVRREQRPHELVERLPVAARDHGGRQRPD